MKYDGTLDIAVGMSAGSKLEEMCQIMGEPVSWAPGLILTADGYLTKYYKKD